jgi:hypothetical protein
MSRSIYRVAVVVVEKNLTLVIIAKNGMIYTTPDPPNPLKKGELD